MIPFSLMVIWLKYANELSIRIRATEKTKEIMREPLLEELRDVHTEHCCITHGCKYGDEDCTVATGKMPQSYDCEVCGLEKSKYF